MIELNEPARPWAVRAIYGTLAVEIALVIGFSSIYSSLDFHVYMWGGHAVAHDTRLYLAQAVGHWFTYTPFAADVFAPMAAMPMVIARVLWQLASVAAFAVACVTTLKLAGIRASCKAIVAVVASGLLLEPIYHTLFEGQINLILLALILTDVRSASRGRWAGIGVGVAAATKLTPAIFIVLLLVSGRVRAALTAAATFACCGLVGFLVAPGASRLYWFHLCYDTHRIGAPYISNQSPYGAAIRIAGGYAQVGNWYPLVPLTIGVAGLAAAAVLARHEDWLGAAAAAGATGLLVSPISWSHHWVWIMPALVVLLRGGTRCRIAALCGYLLFVLAPLWWTPRSGGPREYGFHGLLTLVANSYLLAGLAFLGYMIQRARLISRQVGDDGGDGSEGLPPMTDRVLLGR